MAELKLRIHVDGNPERVLSLSHGELIVGRLPECDLCLPFSEVSRHHSRIYQNRDGQWFVEDLGSTNGTVVNQVLLQGPHCIEHNDAIQIGNAFIMVYLVETHAARRTQVSSRTQHTILRSAEELQQQWLNVDYADETFSTQQRMIARLQYLVEISKGLSSAESIDAIFEKVQSIIFKELNDIQRLALLVDVEGDGTLRLVDAAARHQSNATETHSHSWISRSICKKVFSDKVAIKTVDAQADERFEGEQSILAKGIRGALAVPLWDKNQVVGVLYADANLRLMESGDAANDEEDLSFFSTVANLVAYSVQRWLLRRRLQGEERIRQQLERYHSPAVVQQLIARGKIDQGRVDPIETEISIIFADIVGFTAMAERMTPSQIAQMLDRFFEEMLQFVFAMGGTLDKFIGDCIMAFFGAPDPQEDHADRAVRAALGMLKRLDQLNASGAWAEPLELHVAINSGRAVVGDVGSSQRVDYTVLGTTVNLAARMEGICPPSECVISADTYNRLTRRAGFYLLGDRNFKGIDRPVPIYQTRRRKSTVQSEDV
jgi:class 3 adenylate cyclase